MKLTGALVATGLFVSVGALQAQAFGNKAAYKQQLREYKASVAAFKKTDKDDDGQLTLDEFEALMKPLVKELRGKGKHGENPQLTADLEFAASALFEWFDWDMDSGISQSEWTSRQFGVPWDSALDLGLIPFGAVDRNADGKATAGEFKALVSGYVPAWIADYWCYYFLHPEKKDTYSSGSLSGGSLSISR